MIPSLKVDRSFYIGKNISIFTAELIAIAMGLFHILENPLCVNNILFCVDSKSVLQALDSNAFCNRAEIITEIKQLIHSLSSKGYIIAFCWIPSHCGIYGNDWADRTARTGAKNSPTSTHIKIPLCLQESYKLLNDVIDDEFQQAFKRVVVPKFDHNKAAVIIVNLLLFLLRNHFSIGN